MVDRVALTNQTVDEYMAYDPENTEGSNGGVVTDTANRWALANKLKRKGNGIIVTSTQKMDAMVRSKDFKPVDKNLVFIVDEAHRSTSGEMRKEFGKLFLNRPGLVILELLYLRRKMVSLKRRQLVISLGMLFILIQFKMPLKMVMFLDSRWILRQR